MKRMIFAIATTIASLSIYAQEPMGGGGFGGGRPPMGNYDGMDEQEATEVVKFPEIPQLTEKQKDKVISVVIKEHDDVAKLEDQKRTVFMKNAKFDHKGQEMQPNKEGNAQDQRQRSDEHKMKKEPPVLSSKDQAKVDKIQKKEGNVHQKADKKFKSILSKDQYAVFQEKKSEIKFNTPDKNNKQRQGNQREGFNHDNNERPDGPMDGGGGGGGF